MIESILNNDLLIYALKALTVFCGICWLGWGIFKPKHLIKLKNRPPFETTYFNAMHSDEVTRIVVGRFNNGNKLCDEERNEILEKYGPQKNIGIFKSHYKDVKVNQSYFKNKSHD